MKTYRIGIIGTENSHATDFGKLFNKPDENGNFLYPDFHITLVYGHDREASEKLVAEGLADAVAESVEEMLGQVDAVMITARDGKYHAEFAEPFIKAGIPAFVDKPFTTDIPGSLSLARLAKEHGVALCGGSSLKYAEDIALLKEAKANMGEFFVCGNVTAPLSITSPYSGFWFYASHLVEMCLEAFGYEPCSVMAQRQDMSVYAIVKYDNFAVTCNFVDAGYATYSGTVLGKKTMEQRKISLANVSRLECDSFVDMVREGKMAHSYDELVAPVFLIDAIIKSYETNQEVKITFEKV